LAGGTPALPGAHLLLGARTTIRPHIRADRVERCGAVSITGKGVAQSLKMLRVLSEKDQSGRHARMSVAQLKKVMAVEDDRIITGWAQAIGENVKERFLKPLGFVVCP
jgi:hypothetical protein